MFYGFLIIFVNSVLNNFSVKSQRLVNSGFSGGIKGFKHAENVTQRFSVNLAVIRQFMLYALAFQ